MVVGGYWGRVSGKGASIYVPVSSCLAVAIYPDLVLAGDICDGVGSYRAGGEFGWMWEGSNHDLLTDLVGVVGR